MFPDAEAVLVTLLDDLGYTCTFLPDEKEWRDMDAVIVVNRVGGGSDGITDRPLLQVGVYAKDSRTRAWSVAGQVRERLLNAGGTAVDGALIDSVREAQGVQQFPDLNPDNKFVAATFQLSFRRIFA
ncbi:phage tail termination protein [Rhodococcoides fascians]|uniref:phage tail termination protein n=1 Tax=Rhodococcoides fascians TaxID=1828 RepID=UPI00068E9DBC|nr:hypothetical protein [Rhodococcus fascians]